MAVELLHNNGESTLFAPLHIILEPSLDEFFIPFVEDKIHYLLEEAPLEEQDPPPKITIEKLELGLNVRETRYFEDQIFSDLRNTIDRFATFATTGEKNIDAIFEDRMSPSPSSSLLPEEHLTSREGPPRTDTDPFLDYGIVVSTGEETVTATTETARTLYDFAEYLNEYDRQVDQLMSESGRPYCTKYLAIENKIYFRHNAMSHLSQQELVKAYMNKNVRAIIMSYVENYLLQLLSPLK